MKQLKLKNMKIAVRAEIATEPYEKYNDVLKNELRSNVCKELMKHNVFIEPPTRTGRNGYTTMEMHFFALSYSDIDRLRELSDKYPEMKKVLQDIIVIEPGK